MWGNGGRSCLRNLAFDSADFTINLSFKVLGVLNSSGMIFSVSLFGSSNGSLSLGFSGLDNFSQVLLFLCSSSRLSFCRSGLSSLSPFFSCISFFL